jgi:hypothetical protein
MAKAEKKVAKVPKHKNTGDVAPKAGKAKAPGKVAPKAPMKSIADVQKYRKKKYGC